MSRADYDSVRAKRKKFTRQNERKKALAKQLFCLLCTFFIGVFRFWGSFSFFSGCYSTPVFFPSEYLFLFSVSPPSYWFSIFSPRFTEAAEKELRKILCNLICFFFQKQFRECLVVLGKFNLVDRENVPLEEGFRSELFGSCVFESFQCVFDVLCVWKICVVSIGMDC